jgi:uncharacterized protein YicC (UPF0701 family)
MTDQHKTALAIGRAEGRAVRDYLDGLRASKPKRGRKRTAESISARLEVIEEELASADPLSELKLVQERMDLTNELEHMDAGIDLTALEDEFVKIAKGYSERQGISYAAWREVGVDAAVLRKASIGRGSA